jgi:oxaloacetate decarboxylase alpha subunit
MWMFWGRICILPWEQEKTRGKKMFEKMKQAVADETAQRGGKARTITLTDSTFRDGQQCLWATRMKTEHMLPVAAKLDQTGFETMETIALVQYDGAVIFLQENPFERIRLQRREIRNTPMRAAVRSNMLAGFAPVGFDITKLFIERQVAAGVRDIAFLESLHAWEIIAPGIEHARKLGVKTTAAVLYNDAPGYDAEYYTQVSRDAAAMGVDRIMFADAGGTMTREKVREIIPAVRSAIGDVVLEFNTHCLTGLGPQLALEAAVLGADAIFVTAEPMAFGPAPPGAQMIARNLRELGYHVPLDLKPLEEAEAYFYALAERENQTVGKAAEFDPRQYQTQYAGGALENMKAQLAATGIADRLQEVLDEITRVRLDLGSPIMATPFPAIIAAQAVMNVLHGERYRVVPDEVKKYVCGHYGNLRIPVDGNVADRVIANGSKKISLEAQEFPPVLPGLRKRYPDMSEEQLILRFMYGDERIDALKPIREDATFTIAHPLEVLMGELAKMQPKTSVYISADDFSFRAG